ncbi:MAG: YceI family protein [Pseudomonadota bacterium]|nr:YceI family protein [Pseudomonadota bacterium]
MLKRLSLAVALSCLAITAAADTTWKVDHDQSALSFAVEIGGTEAVGAFGRWDADITFDPTAPELGTVVVSIDIASVRIDDDRAQAIADPAWLGAADHPTARFASTAFDLASDGTLTVPGTLTLKGIDLPLTLTGTLSVENSTARADLSSTIDRTSHDIGVGQNTVAPDVAVTATLLAHCVAD